MAVDDLNKPLGQPNARLSSKPKMRPSQLFMFGSLAFLSLFVAGLISWIILVDDPHGGFPTQTVSLSGTLSQHGKIGVEGIRPAIKPGIPETARPSRPSTLNQSSDAQSPPDDGAIRILDPSDPSLSNPVSQTQQRPYEIFARPINTDAIAGIPKIAIIVDGLGLSQTTTQEALSILPPDITLAFAPYGTSLNRWTQKARSQGHELLVQVPMEPFDYPNNDPGPHTLLTSVNTAVNTKNLNWILNRFDGYVGTMNYMGARFASDELAGTDFMRNLNERGLMFVESGASGRSRLSALAKSSDVPSLRADLIIDIRGRSQDIQTRLIQLESLAQENGIALGVATAFPASIRAISEWSQNLRQRGFALVPITILLKQ